MSRIIEIPDWCKIGLYIEFCDPALTGSTDWYKEKIVGYSDSGFFHQDCNYPVYHTEFSDTKHYRLIKY